MHADVARAGDQPAVTDRETGRGRAAARAEELWRSGTRQASVDAAAAWIEVARIRERQRGDLRGALEAAAAASRILDLAFALGRGGSLEAIGRTRILVEGRVRRLRSWLAAADRRAAAHEAVRQVA